MEEIIDRLWLLKSKMEKKFNLFETKEYLYLIFLSVWCGKNLPQKDFRWYVADFETAFTFYAEWLLKKKGTIIGSTFYTEKESKFVKELEDHTITEEMKKWIQKHIQSENLSTFYCKINYEEFPEFKFHLTLCKIEFELITLKDSKKE